MRERGRRRKGNRNKDKEKRRKREKKRHQKRNRMMVVHSIDPSSFSFCYVYATLQDLYAHTDSTELEKGERVSIFLPVPLI